MFQYDEMTRNLKMLKDNGINVVDLGSNLYINLDIHHDNWKDIVELREDNRYEYFSDFESLFLFAQGMVRVLELQQGDKS